MNFNEYQKSLIKCDLCNGQVGEMPIGLIEKVLGLAGEAGETVDKFKKIFRDKNGVISEEDKQEIVKELGDVLWYVATIARYLDVPLEEVVAKNVEKMESRLKRGVLHGEGDNR